MTVAAWREGARLLAPAHSAHWAGMTRGGRRRLHASENA
ncbi:hypothetical protein GGD41_007541 [Paraburkholderia bryophila]|uniref:Uncharacterized protein n=1 Tax=Paraburkholderia bryophila TaxID=420952 RepID=A0A7Z0B5F0_9BURK|nr:hypothetical protein [Paraburkholderia bryophila]NYH20660.1 hypothetical protein [Paraburkholderia bryophila]